MLACGPGDPGLDETVEVINHLGSLDLREASEAEISRAVSANRA